MATAAKKSPTPIKHHLDRRAPQIIDSISGDPEYVMSQKEVEALLGVSNKFLEAGRANGFGPPFTYVSERVIRYRRGDLIDWLRSRTARSTKDYKKIAAAAEKEKSKRLKAKPRSSRAEA